VYDELSKRIQAFIKDPQQGDFDQLALEAFHFQYDHNSTYRTFCQLMGVSKADVTSWWEIPIVPTQMFKISTFFLDGYPARYTFQTSGTTTGQPGRHLFFDVSLMRTAIQAQFRRYFGADTFPHTAVFLDVPSRPNSSLRFMFQEFQNFFRRSVWVDITSLEDIERFLQKLCDEPPQVMYWFGTSLAFYHLLARRDRWPPFPRHPGSVIMDTGGFKGRKIRLTQWELYKALSEFLEVPERNIVNEYGMTELASQFYDHVARREEERLFRPSHWLRFRILDERGRDSEEGGLVVYDLANLDTAIAIQTGDRARAYREGFQLLGRLDPQDWRGCSLTIEEWLEAHG